MRGLLQQSQIAQESIDFQSTAFFKELVLHFDAMKKLPAKEIAESDIIGAVTAVIKNRTGLKVSLDIGLWEPSVSIPQLNKNHPLVNQNWRDYASSADGMRLITDAGGAARGTVNINTGKVTGVFEDIQSTVNLPLEIFQGTKYSAEEIAAITMHELGHIFVYCEYFSRTVTSNQALAGMSKLLDKSAGAPEREVVLISVKKALGLKDLDAAALAKSSNTRIAEIVVISNSVQKAASELGHNVYDFNSWEYLADQYAARQGGGRYLVTALDKLYRGYAHMSFRSTPAYLAFEALKLVLVIVPPFFLGMLLLAFDSDGDGTYDRPGARMKRVRNQIVENMKDTKLSKDDVASLAADLVVIDDITSAVNDRRQLLGVIIDNISPTSRRARSQEVLQRDLEDIAGNDLFIKAAELRQLA